MKRQKKTRGAREVKRRKRGIVFLLIFVVIIVVVVVIVSVILYTTTQSKRDPPKRLPVLSSSESNETEEDPATTESNETEKRLDIKDEIIKEGPKTEWKDRSTGTGKVKLGDPMVLTGAGAAVSIDVNSLTTYKRTLNGSSVGDVFILYVKADSGNPAVRMKHDNGEFRDIVISSTSKDWTEMSGTSKGTGEVLFEITKGDGVLQLTTKKTF